MSRTRWNILIIVLLIAGLAWIWVNRLPAGDVSATSALPPAPAVGHPAPDFTLTTAAGETFKLSELRGIPVVLNFWATWCPPCRDEMPSMERLHKLLGGRDLEIVAVDLQEPKDTVQKFVKDNSLTFTVLLDARGAVGGAWGAQSIPTTYLIDRKGRILARSVGGRQWDSADMVALFEAVLAAE
jgi:cytochrome c biogenesis protein CcmG/thiol:disulfide interchange protein DsbE